MKFILVLILLLMSGILSSCISSLDAEGNTEYFVGFKIDKKRAYIFPSDKFEASCITPLYTTPAVYLFEKNLD